MNFKNMKLQITWIAALIVLSASVITIALFSEPTSNKCTVIDNGKYDGLVGKVDLQYTKCHVKTDDVNFYFSNFSTK